MKRRHFLGAAGAAACLPLLPRAARAVRLRTFGGELVAAILEPAPATLRDGSPGGMNPRTLDPFAARTRLERELAAALHLPLFGMASAGRPFGPLVESATARGRTWEIELHRGLAFADGSPVRAEDAAASLSRLPAGTAALLDAERIEAAGAHTVAITLRRPFDRLPELLAACGSPLASAAPGDAFFGPAGCGAFRPAAPGAARPTAEVTLAANVRCPAGRAYVDRLRLVPVPEAAALSAAFRKGLVDVAAAATAATEVSGAGLASWDAAATVVLALSPRLSPALRTRIAASPDRAILSQVFLKDRVRPAGTLLPPALLGPLAPEAAPARDLAKGDDAKKLSLLVAHASPEMEDVAARLQWNLREAGVHVTTGWRSPAELETVAEQGRWDLLLFEWVPRAADAGWALAAATAATPWLPGGAAVNEAARGALVRGDADERTRRARELDDALRAAGLVPVVHPRRLLRVSPRVEGLAPDPRGFVAWADVGLARGAR